VNWQITMQSPNLNFTNTFFYSVSIVTLVAFERFCQIFILPNPLFQQIAKYYIHQYLFLYGTFLLDYLTMHCHMLTMAVIYPIHQVIVFYQNFISNFVFTVNFLYYYMMANVKVSLLFIHLLYELALSKYF